MRAILLCLLSGVVGLAFAQAEGPWNGKRCAVVLTYDDALNVHLDNAIPLLDSLGLRATFYVPTNFPGFAPRMDEWKAIAARGHELGNHTVYHPCRASIPGREWVKSDYDMDRYSIDRMADEVAMANLTLRALDGRSERTFAYPCGETRVADGSYVGRIRPAVAAARSVTGRIEQRDSVDLMDIGSYVVIGQSGEQLVDLAQQAINQQGLVVFLFHGVGGEHRLDVTLEAHRQLLTFLKEHQQDIWVAPLVDVARSLKGNR